MSNMFLTDADNLLRILLVGTSTYVGLVVLLRMSGKRTLAQMNAFDFVVTIALGSILAATVLDRSVSWVEGMAALLLLVMLQLLLTTLSVRSARFRSLVASEPALLLHEGEMLAQAMRRERVTREELLHALRDAGLDGPESAHSVVLEADGRFSVVPASAATKSPGADSRGGDSGA